MKSVIKNEKKDEDDIAFDFSNIDDDLEDDSPTLWDVYTKICYSQTPPIPTLSLMKPILSGDETNAIFPHQQISNHLPIILQMLNRVKIISVLNLSNNSLTSKSVGPLVSFITEADQLSSLNINDNPLIGPEAMNQLIQGIKENSVLEELMISNTGCNASVGKSISELIIGCTSLAKLDISHCQLGQSGLEIARAIGSSPKLRRINLSNNELHIGSKKFGVLLGTNVAKCTTLSRIDLSGNFLSTDQVISMFRGFSNSTSLTRLDFSRNNICEPAGKSIATFITKSKSIKHLRLDQNPILNVTLNKMKGQKKLQEEQQKPGGNKKDKKPKTYSPGCYLILNSLAKNQSLVDISLIGVIAPTLEWKGKLANLANINPNVHVIYQESETETFNFSNPKTALASTIAQIDKPSSSRKPVRSVTPKK